MPPPDARFALAFGQPSLTADPDWTTLDDTAHLVAGYQIDRGRQYELDRTDTGRATVTINDTDGLLDPTNTTGPYWGGGYGIVPLTAAIIRRRNPVTDTWHTRYRGFVEDYSYEFDPSQQVNRLTLTLVDLFEILSAIQFTPGNFGQGPLEDPPLPAVSEGQIWYPNQTMQDRCNALLDDALSAPQAAEHTVVSSGNVRVQGAVYSVGESVMDALQEAVDAEFPGVSNIYTDRHGRVQIHGRLAKFDPAGTYTSTLYDPWSGATAYNVGDQVMSGGLAYQCVLGHTNHVPPNATYWQPIPRKWDFNQWKVGDGAAVTADPTTTGQVREFGFHRGLSRIINSALATPKGIADSAVEDQLVTDGTSIGRYWIRSWSAQNLITSTGILTSADALTETKRFASYYVANYKDARDRINAAGLRSIGLTAAGAAPTWHLLSEVDIADTVEVTVSSPGGGGFNLEPYFVEGVHETVRPLNPEMDDVTLTLDLSPRAYFTDTSMFPGE